MKRILYGGGLLLLDIMFQLKVVGLGLVSMVSLSHFGGLFVTLLIWLLVGLKFVLEMDLDGCFGETIDLVVTLLLLCFLDFFVFFCT